MKTRRIWTQETRWKGKRYLGSMEAGTEPGCPEIPYASGLGVLPGLDRPTALRARQPALLARKPCSPASTRRLPWSAVVPLTFFPGAPTLCSQIPGLRSVPAPRRSQKKGELGLEPVLPTAQRRAQPLPASPAPPRPSPAPKPRPGVPPPRSLWCYRDFRPAVLTFSEISELRLWSLSF